MITLQEIDFNIPKGSEVGLMSSDAKYNYASHLEKGKLFYLKNSKNIPKEIRDHLKNYHIFIKSKDINKKSLETKRDLNITVRTVHS